MATAPQTKLDPRQEARAVRPDAFLTYAREDSDVVERLIAGLDEHDKAVWVDREEIPFSTSWRERAHAGIEAAKAVVVVLSEHWLGSPACRWELEQAVQRNKRLVPVLAGPDLPAESLPSELADLAWIPLREKSAIEELVRTLDTDVGWRDRHARLLVRAVEWDRQQRDASYLLRGSDLRAAEAWLDEQDKHEQRALPLQSEYILAGRRATSRRQRTWLLIGALALGVAVVLAVLAYWQRGVAVDNEREANEQRRAAVENARQARSRELAATAMAELDSDPELSLLLGIEAAKVAPTAQAQEALRAALPRTRTAAALPHEGLEDVALSATGAAVTGGTDTLARVWDLGAGRRIATLRGHRTGLYGEAMRGVMGVAVAEDAGVAVTAGVDGTARVWNARSGEQLHVMRGHRGPILDVALSPDGRVLATAGEDGTVRAWDRDTGVQRYVERTRGSALTDVRFSPDGRLLATAFIDTGFGSTGVTVREATTGRPIARPATGQVFQLEFSPDSRRLATVGVGSSARVWDARTGERLAEVPGHGRTASALAFSPDGGIVASGGENGSVKLFEAEGGRVVQTLQGHRGSVSDISFDADGRLIATAATDETAQVWDVATGRRLRTLRGHRAPVWFVDFEPRGDRVVTAGADGKLRLWATPVERPSVELRGHEEVVNDLAFSPDGGRVATASEDGTSRIWDVRGRRSPVTVRHDASVPAVAFSTDGRVLLTAGFGPARLWDAQDGSEVAVLTKRLGSGGTFTADSRHVVVETGAVWDLDGRRAGRLPRLARPPEAAPQGMFATPLDGPAGVFEIPSGRRLTAFRGQAGLDARGGAISPDGRTAAIASDDGVWLWNAVTGQRLSRLPGAEAVSEFSRDGNRLITTSGTEVRLWDVARRRPLADLPHPYPVGQPVFSPDGRLVLTPSWDGWARVWEARTGRQIDKLEGRSTEEYSESFTPVAAFGRDGTTVAAATGGRTAFVHDCRLCAPLAGLLRVAERTVTRRLTADERLTYME